MTPKLSIVTPSFNQAPYLEQTLRSVLSQRDQIHEYFVYDGGSTDGSTDIIKKYASQIDYWISEKDKGQSDAIARGFARATGDYLAWINSDDVYLPAALARIRAALDAHPDWDAVSANHARIDAQSRLCSLHRVTAESRAAALRGVFHPHQPTVFFRRTLYEKVGGLNSDLHLVFDTELFYRILDAGAHWGHLPQYLAAFRQHPQSKGIGTPDKYAGEYAFLNDRYPHYHAPTVRHFLGRAAHKAMQFLSGREFAARRDTGSWRGQTIEECFGPWLMKRREPTDNPDSTTHANPI
ncbi:MAG: glycosyltransferase involved in cell wall bioproteinis [Phycisphaerales bacterium]|nr:glycosyltransferase involved in cell wall bioproteinis [Phycisphaerales bacterium]